MEYWITHVKIKNKKIQQVKALLNTVEGLKNPNIYNRKEIVNSIEDKDDDWYTCILAEKKDEQRIWKKESKIYTVEINNEKYLRTDKEKKEADKLGELPSFSYLK
jgi:hypothetical protein